MATTRKVVSNAPVSRKQKPAMSPEAREQQMIAYAVDLAEKQLREGTASSQVITHYLKLGTQKEKLENQKAEEELKLIRAKTEAYESQKDIKELYSQALKAMRAYNGDLFEEDDEDGDSDED